jgi:hypothetical protein
MKPVDKNHARGAKIMARKITLTDMVNNANGLSDIDKNELGNLARGKDPKATQNLTQLFSSLPEGLRKDPDIVRAALSMKDNAVSFASQTLQGQADANRGDRDFVLSILNL